VAARARGRSEEDDLFSRLEAEDASRLWTVGDLTREIKTALEELGKIRVEGEVSRVVRAASGHLYFDLKDIDAKISCTVWKSQIASAVRFDLAEGAKVIAHGRLDVYGPRGTYSLSVQRLEPSGLGALLLRLEKLKAELKALGWFDRKRPLPSMPRRVGVVTSRDGAALQDFLRTRSLRWPLYPVVLAHTSVQGANAAEQIAAAIRRVDAHDVDVIVVCRGGGSLEDLWAFNERAVAEAIWNTRVPVVTGVGHETDVTLADFVADHRAHTPTDAAQTVLPELAALLLELETARNHLLRAIDGSLEARIDRLDRAAASPVLRNAGWMLDRRAEELVHLARSLRLSVAAALDRSAARIARATTRLSQQSPAVKLERRSSRVSALAPRLSAAIAAPLERIERRLDVARASLEATSPFAVLERGYSITEPAEGGAPFKTVEGLASGKKIRTVLASGWIVSEVDKTGREVPDHSGGRAPGAQ
jgi:exodeoxyribonuclease VII large subunit